MKVLAITKIYPNSEDPLSSPFNRQQFTALGQTCELEVMATIPWFPMAAAFKRWSAAGRLVGVPTRELIDGLSVKHPRFAYVPGASAASGALYAASLLPAVMRRKGRVDAILGSWAYPDGFAAVVLARAIGVPAIIKLHGSDINVLGSQARIGPQLRWALSSADAVVAVSEALGDAAVELGAPRARVHVVLNGVDRELFRPRDRGEARRALGQPEGGRLVLYVGRLEQAKGAVDLLEAFEKVARVMPDARLVMVGDGAAKAACATIAGRLGPRALLVGARPHAEVTRWMAACDVLSLPSWNEGTPNVVIEALASGRRVVATRVGGIPALLRDPALGALVAARDVDALADALKRALDHQYDPAQVAAIAGFGDWAQSALRLRHVIEQAVVARASTSEARHDGRIEGPPTSELRPSRVTQQERI